jgi:hypothetical protein
MLDLEGMLDCMAIITSGAKGNCSLYYSYSQFTPFMSAHKHTCSMPGFLAGLLSVSQHSIVPPVLMNTKS